MCNFETLRRGDFETLRRGDFEILRRRDEETLRLGDGTLCPMPYAPYAAIIQTSDKLPG